MPTREAQKAKEKAKTLTICLVIRLPPGSACVCEVKYVEGGMRGGTGDFPLFLSLALSQHELWLLFLGGFGSSDHWRKSDSS